MKNKICLVYNFAQHYRENIFCLLDKELNCDFVFGDKYLDIKKMDYSLFKNNVYERKSIFLSSGFYFLKNNISCFKKKYSVYIVLGEPLFLDSWIILLRCFFTRKRVYLWSHGWYGRETFPKKIIKRFFFSLSTGVFLYGNYAKKLMVKEGFNSSKLHVIHNSLSYDKQIKLRNKLKESDIFKSHFQNNYPNLIFTGRLTKVKKLDMILRFIKYSKEKGVPYNLVLVGTGEEEVSLHELAFSLNISKNIWFFGPCYKEEIISDLIFNADLCVSPGNVGLTAMHAMVYGCPVITHNNFPCQMPEFEAIKSGITGDFYTYGNEESFFNTIENWFLNQNYRHDVRLACYREIDNFWTPEYQLKIIKDAINKK